MASNRALWTAAIEGKKAHKYNAQKTGKYASKKEADEAAKLHILFHAGAIKDLQEQVRYTIVPAQGKIRAISYIADFVYKDLDGFTHVCDVKGFRTDVYRLKKKMMQLLLGITVEEL